MATVRTTITIDEKLHKELTDLSKEQERSFSNQIVYLVKKGKEVAYLADLVKIQDELSR